jgi:hypothetical protein
MYKRFFENKRNTRLKLKYFIAAITSLFIGIGIYAFFSNTSNILLFRFFPKMSFLGTQYMPIKKDSIWAYMLLYNLSDGLWCLSALLLIRAIWLANALWNVIYSCIFIVIALAFEIAQLAGVIHGTFDTLDLIFISLFAFLESIIFYLFIRRRIVL